MSDAINPNHYKRGGIECIDVLEAIGVAKDFCRGNCIKYLYRLGEKDDALQEAKKAAWYANRLVQIIEKERNVGNQNDK